MPNGASSLTNIPMTATAVLEETHPFFDDAVDGPRVPVGMAGLYIIHWYIEYNSNVTGSRRYALRLNGSNRQHLYDSAVTGSGPAGQGSSLALRLADGEYIHLAGAQSSGAALALTRSEITLIRIAE
jgi:hypothetical protein